jgi:hypothetical protein
MAQAPVSLPPRRAASGAPVRLDRLAECVRRLDPSTRALLDLSVRRGVRDDAMAPVLRTDPFHLAWRRARALDQLASDVSEGADPAPLGEVRMALEALPGEAWGLPGMGPPALPAAGLSGSEEPWARAVTPGPSDDKAGTSETEALPAASRALVPTTASAELDSPAPAGRVARLDSFAAQSPTLRLALRQLGRAMAAKAVRVVLWRRRADRA